VVLRFAFGCGMLDVGRKIDLKGIDYICKKWPMRIYLVGFMGSGKSTLGKRLARKLDYPFMDLDTEIEVAAGKSVAAIFDAHGEDWFREKERELLHRTVDLSRGVIATGGGTPYYFDNMDFMNAHGVTVYLKMSPLSLVHRLEYARKKRPLVSDLKGEELSRFVREKLESRAPFYNRAHCIIKGESAKPAQVAALVFGA